ncbi:MAG: restriction endonuclease subunit S [Cyclobacteriaceae bacterium]
MSDLVDVISMGPFGSDITVDNYVSSGVPVLNGSNISGVKLRDGFTNYLTSEKAKSLKKANAKRGDIIVTHRGTLGQISYIPEDSEFDNYVISQSQFRVKLKTDLIDPVYFTYYFHTSEGQKRLLSFKNHVGVPALAQATTNFRLLEIPYQAIDTQRQIAKVLSDLDSKIELNNKINAELEAMAKLIYDYWFVQFDFPTSAAYAASVGKPNLKDRPYKSSGGKMVYSEELKREIPEAEGWGVGIIESLLDIELGGTPSTKVAEFWGGDIPWLDSGEIANFPIIEAMEHITEKAIENSATSLMPAGTCVLSITRHLRPSILAVDSCANQSVVGIYESDKLKSSYIYPYLKNEIPRLMTLRTGAQQPHINKGTIDESLIISPPEDILVMYYGKVDSMYKKIINNALQNKHLASLRDWLLPMLMNGQVRVGDVQEELSMAAEELVGYSKKL